MTTPHDHSTNPLHGITLERMLNELVAEFGWARMGTPRAHRLLHERPERVIEPQVPASYAMGADKGRGDVPRHEAEDRARRLTQGAASRRSRQTRQKSTDWRRAPGRIYS